MSCAPSKEMPRPRSVSSTPMVCGPGPMLETEPWEGDDEELLIVELTEPEPARPEPEPEPEPEIEEMVLEPDLGTGEDLALEEEPEEAPAEADAPSGSRTGSGSGSKSSSKGGSTPSKRDPKRAQTEAAKGQAAFKAGRLGEAEAAYHRALAADRSNLTALSGLAELHFEHGDYLKAATFGRRAISLAPKNAKLRILVGDAYFKLVRYDEAREQYERAKSLGNGSAAGRLARLDKKLGQ